MKTPDFEGYGIIVDGREAVPRLGSGLSNIALIVIVTWPRFDDS